MKFSGKVWRKLLSTARKLDLPRHYRTDLTKHDRLALAGKYDHVPKRFLWVIYDCGTHIVGKNEMGQAGGKYVRMSQIFRQVLDTCFTVDRHCFVFDGEKLTEYHDKDSAIDALEAL